MPSLKLLWNTIFAFTLRIEMEMGLELRFVWWNKYNTSNYVYFIWIDCLNINTGIKKIKRKYKIEKYKSTLFEFNFLFSSVYFIQ